MRDQEKIFRDYPVAKAIAAMALPVVLMMVVMIVYNMADMFFVSQLKNTTMVAAVSVVGPVFALVMSLGNMLGGGGSTLIARSLGAGRTNQVKMYGALCLWGGLVLGLLMTTLLLIFDEQILLFLGSNEEIRVYAKPYLDILAIGAPIMVVSAAFGNVLRSVGAIKEGMVANLTGTVVNVVLDPLLILVLGQGVQGAAIATVIGNAAALAICLFAASGAKWGLSLSLPLAVRNVREFPSILAIGLPSLAMTGLSSVASALANQLMVGYGTDAVAAMAAAGKATMIISMIQMGLSIGVQPLMAYSYGANDKQRLAEVVRFMTVLTLTIGIGISALCLLEGKWVIGLFLKEEEVLNMGIRMLHLLVLSGPFIGFFYLGTNFLQASGRAALSTVVSVLRQGLLLIPLLYVLNAAFGVTGNILAHMAADISSSVIAAVLMWKQYREFTKEIGTFKTQAEVL